jgi:hypothetical protein
MDRSDKAARGRCVLDFLVIVLALGLAVALFVSLAQQPVPPI